MKFDTRDKKPALWGILIQAVLVALADGVLIWRGADRNVLPISVLMDAFLLAVLIQLVLAFLRQLQYNPYSYNTIYYMGFALFTLAVLLRLLQLTALVVFQPQACPASRILHLLLDSARHYILLTSPFLVVFSVALCVSNISLIRHEGRRLVNVLGILLSVLLVAGVVFFFWFDQIAAAAQWKVMAHELTANLFAAVYLYVECMIIGAIVADNIAARYEPEYDKDFIIILGCGIRPDGTPSPLLRGRIDRALAFAEKQYALTGREVIFVTSGGQGPNEACSESAAMKRYLLQQGVPESRIIEEDQSTSTRENMRFSKEKITAVNPHGRIAFSTTNYHVFRSGLYARRVKMRAVGMGAKTKWYFWPNAAVREFIGLLTEHRGKQALIFGGMIICYTALTLLACR